MLDNITRLARLLDTKGRCNADQWARYHSEEYKKLVDSMPSGSGIDAGIADLTLEKGKLYITFPFHKMNQDGYYDGWADYTVVVTPDLRFGFTIDVKGRDYNGTKDYLAGLWCEWCNAKA